MKQLFTILGLICAVLATILSVLPLSNLAIFPGIAAILFAAIAYYLSKKAGYIKKNIQFTFLLTSIALAISTYKALFTTVEVVDTEELIIKEETSEQEAIQELEDLDIDLEGLEIEEDLSGNENFNEDENFSIDEDLTIDFEDISIE